MPLMITRTLTSAKRNNVIDDLRSHIERFAKLYTRPQSSRKAYSPKHTGNRSDFARIARRLAGRTIALALGGGGARGIAHVGIVRAFEEAGIPVKLWFVVELTSQIDVVGGVSIGALIGGLYCRNEDVWYMYWRAKEFSQRVTSLWRQLLDLTYPMTAWFTGRECMRIGLRSHSLGSQSRSLEVIW